jgi:hypothetical protein
MNNDALLGRCKEKNQRLLFDEINNSIVGRNDVTASASQANTQTREHSVERINRAVNQNAPPV